MNKDQYVVSFVPGDLFFSSTCSPGTLLERREWPLFHGKPDKKKGKTINLKHENCVVVFLFYFLHTSIRNLGLSGMNMKMKADVRLGMEQRATNSLQLLKAREPRETDSNVLGITNQARPGETEFFIKFMIIHDSLSVWKKKSIKVLMVNTLTTVSAQWIIMDVLFLQKLHHFTSGSFAPAARMFPAIQNVASALIIAPRLRRGMNSEK